MDSHDNPPKFSLRHSMIGSGSKEQSHQQPNQMAQRPQYNRSSFSERVTTAGKEVTAKQLWSMIGLISFLLITVHSLAYAIVEFVMLQGSTEYAVRNPAAACLSALRSSEFDLLETNRFDEWFDDSSVMKLSQTGSFQGAADIQEYIKFLTGVYFDFYGTLFEHKVTPLSLTEDECIVNVVTARKFQINADYGLPVCFENIVSTTLYFTVKPVFLVQKVNVFSSPAIGEALWGQWLNTEGVKDFVCDTMEANCQSTYQMNNLTPQLCRETYDALPATDIEGGGGVATNSKGCRAMHATFAAQNKDHCPHLSYIPETDINGKIKCQEGTKTSKPSDLFTTFELDLVKDFAIQKGFSPDTLMRECYYKTNPDFVGFEEESRYKLGITDKNPLSGLSDTDFLCYFALMLWVTIVLTGLGLEAFVWLTFLQGSWDPNTENLWKIAQFLFPLSATTAFGLAMSHNFLALPMIVIACWKLGFPEILLYLHSGIYDKNKATVPRIVDILNGVGTLIHHSAVALLIGALLTNLIPPSRVVIQVSIPVLMQHWFVLMRYSDNQFAYCVIEILLEIWFEWNAFTTLEEVHQIHWTGGIIAGLMLFAHWIYFIAGGINLIVDAQKAQKNKSKLLNKDSYSGEQQSAIRFYGDEGTNHSPGDAPGIDSEIKEQGISLIANAENDKSNLEPEIENGIKEEFNA